MTIKKARSLMPKVGETVMEIPTVVLWAGTNVFPQPQPARVIWTNPAHRWYLVQFENGFRECYKVPKGEYGPRGGLWV